MPKSFVFMILKFKKSLAVTVTAKFCNGLMPVSTVCEYVQGDAILTKYAWGNRLLRKVDVHNIISRREIIL